MNNRYNRLITKEEVENILNHFENIGPNNQPLRINNLELYQKSFIHESFYQSQIQNSLDEKSIVFPYLSKESNERLEYLGDHILKAILGRYLYQRFPEEREGFLTKLKIKLEKKETLYNFASVLGFKKYLLLSYQLENQTLLDTHRGRNNPSYYEDAFESFLGAISEDFGEQGYIYAERFVRSVIENVIDFSDLIVKNDNFKDSLQRYFQSNKWNTPVYITFKSEKGSFVRGLCITKSQFESLDYSQQKNISEYSLLYSHFKPKDKDYILCLGHGKKVINAEQNAAMKGLENLNLNLNY